LRLTVVMMVQVKSAKEHSTNARELEFVDALLVGLGGGAPKKASMMIMMMMIQEGAHWQ
jgi:hypothetical protein